MSKDVVYALIRDEDGRQTRAPMLRLYGTANWCVCCDGVPQEPLNWEPDYSSPPGPYRVTHLASGLLALTHNDFFRALLLCDELERLCDYDPTTAAAAKNIELRIRAQDAVSKRLADAREEMMRDEPEYERSLS